MVSDLTLQSRRQYDPGTPLEVPVPDTSLITLLETSARLYPERIAVDYFGATLTYAQLYAQVLRAAQVLIETGLRRGDVCAICLPNCPQALVAFYACMRIGVVAAEHNPLAPAEEIHQQLDRHRGKVAIVWEKSVDAFIREGDKSLDTIFTVDISAGMPRSQRMLLSLPIERARQTREQMRAARPKDARSWDQAVAHARLVHPDTPQATGDDLAVILHTGGTNGVPKSVPLTHRNIGTNVNQCRMWVWKLHEGAETFYSLLPYFHAYGLTFFMCAAVHLAATHLLLPKFDIEGYGMSETSPVIAGSPLADNRYHGALGVVFPSTDVRLVDLEDPSIDVEDGTPGEIIVKGPQVFSGYLDAPEETARVFTEDGWLRTGDVAINKDGFLVMSDRKKELILSGGFNVYPSQVEAAIRSMPGVKDVAVVGLPAGEAREEVTAALILEDDAPMITLAQVRAWAEKYVSHYALPRQIAIITDLPRNPLGKVMRRKVKEQLLDPANRMIESAQRAIGEAAAAVSERLSPGDTATEQKSDENE